MPLDPFDSRELEYVIGLILAALWPVFSGVMGLDRARSFYPTVLIVITSYSVLFAAMGGTRQILLVKIVVAKGFSAVAVLDSRKYSADTGCLDRTRAVRLRPSFRD